MNELEQKVGMVLSRLSHDLKNPLAVVLSNLRFLQMSMKEDSDDAEAINESLISAVRLDRILNDAVDIHRIRNQQYVPSKIPCSIKDLEKELKDRLELLIGRRTFDVDLASLQLLTDRDILLRVLLNLLEHAFRNTRTGGTVRLRGARIEKGLMIQVLDEGAPFSPNTLPSFMQEELETKQPPMDQCRSDQGMSLHFAGIAARALGAEIDCLPRQDNSQGVCFQLVFPRVLVV